MGKTFVLDTNVLITDPHAIYKFAPHDVVVPLIVLIELDKLKKRHNTGPAARTASGEIDSLRELGKLHEGVDLPSGGNLKVWNDIPESKLGTDNDYAILEQCKRHEGAILVTEDTAMRVIADSLGIPVQRYKNTYIDSLEIYESCKNLESPRHIIDAFHDEKGLHWLDGGFYDNEYFQLGTGTLAKYKESEKLILPLSEYNRLGVKARNREQAFALDALMDPEVHMVVLAGPSGTGKTLLATAAGIGQAGTTYKSVMVSRPVVPLGNDIGYLPGTMEDKMDPWMGPIYDAIEVIINSSDPRMKGKNASEYCKDFGLINVQPLTYIRGRSLPNQFILIDEAQQLTPHMVKAIVTRVAKGSKLVFTGDPYQVDSPYLDAHNNGISHIISKFRGSKRFAYVTLTKGERSELAEYAAKVL